MWHGGFPIHHPFIQHFDTHLLPAYLPGTAWVLEIQKSNTQDLPSRGSQPSGRAGHQHAPAKVSSKDVRGGASGVKILKEGIEPGPGEEGEKGAPSRRY